MRRLLSIIMVLVLCLSFEAPCVSFAATIKLNKSKMEMKVDDTYTLKLTGSSGVIKWSSSDKAVASVSQKGKVTALTSGKATITAKYANKIYKCVVTVEGSYIKVTTIALLSYDEKVSDFLSTINFKKVVNNDEEGTITYTMTKAQQKLILTFLRKYIIDLVDEEIKSDEDYSYYNSITMNKDMTIFDVFLDKAEYTVMDPNDFSTYDSMIIALMMLSSSYQEYAGINDDDMKFLVHIYDYETNEEIDTFDSSEE